MDVECGWDESLKKGRKQTERLFQPFFSDLLRGVRKFMGLVNYARAAGRGQRRDSRNSFSINIRPQ